MNPNDHSDGGPDNLFDRLAGDYDAWFDRSPGAEIFAQEVAALRRVADYATGRWLEVGVGTGRFAAALGIPEGVDPSLSMLALARTRQIHTIEASGESLPLNDLSIDGVLLVTTICFVDRPREVFEEARRVLRPSGTLVVGLVPADSPWGRVYAEKAKEGHRFYRVAAFYSIPEVVKMAGAAGFEPVAFASCLGTPPDRPVPDAPPRDGIIPSWGFVAMSFRAGG